MSTAKRPSWSDYEFADSVSAATHRGAHPGLKLLLATVTALLAAGLYWASHAMIDEVARAHGRVIPSGKTQVVQSLEGGIIKEILVGEGDKVKRGQVLLRIKDTTAAANLGELVVQKQVLQARIARLEAETANAETPDFGADLSAAAPVAVARERVLFDSRKAKFDSQLLILREQRAQKSDELNEMENRIKRLTQGADLLQEEIGLMRTSGVVPRARIIPVEREMNDQHRQIEAAHIDIARNGSQIREADQRIREQTLTFTQEADKGLAEAQAKLSVIEQSMTGAQDRVVRADIRSPVDGLISGIRVNTVGGVIRAGADILDIVPLEENLLVEAQARPSDIAFITSGLRATVKITAYDFTIYGALKGEVLRVGADSLVDKATGKRYFPIVIRTSESALSHQGKQLPIKPGMVATVDVLTGRKSVLNYILKPLRKARYESLSER